MVEALMSLVAAVKQLQDDQLFGAMQAAGDDTIIHEQGSIVEQYWEIIRPFYTGATQ